MCFCKLWQPVVRAKKERVKYERVGDRRQLAVRSRRHHDQPCVRMMAAAARRGAAGLCHRLCPLVVARAARTNPVCAASLHTSPVLDVEGIPIKMPSLSPTMMEGTIVKWLKQEGEAVQPGDVLCDIQTDKAVVSMDVEEEGILAKILVPDDSKDVKVGTLIAVMAPEGEEDWRSVEVPRLQEEDVPTPTPTPPAAPHGSHGNYGPSVRLLLEQYGLSAAQVPPGGPHGVLLKGDVLSYVQQRGLQPLPLPPVPPPEAPKVSATPAPVPSPAPSSPALASTTQAPPAPGLYEDGSYQEVEVTSMRRTIARRLTQSKTGIAHSYGTLDCCVDELLALRRRYKAEGANVSVNDLLIKAVAIALTACPEMNCVWQGDQLVLQEGVDVSVAVATPAGLITPIVPAAHTLGVEDIAAKVRDLATRARQNKLKLDEFQGGTFTISNLGMFGISEFSAIINPPQCGILAIGGSRLVIDESGVPRTRLSSTLSYDRAAVDDNVAAHFLDTLRHLLEHPDTLLLGPLPATAPHPLAALL